MNFRDDDIAAIQSLGYTPDEARFLYLVAAHSGYFVPRQFLAFSGAKWGKRSNNFVAKLESRGHATWREYYRTGGVYHLFSKTLYRYIGKENLRNRRRHSVEFIRTRLLLLDFILANLSYDYLETEAEKVAHFCDTLGVSRKILPAKSYEGGPRSEPTLRYFVDKFPLFFDPGQTATTATAATATAAVAAPAAHPASPPPTLSPSLSPSSSLLSASASPTTSAPVVTFSYVDPGQASLAGFANHLHAYLPLLRQLERFAFLYIATSPIHFVSAERCFASLVRTPLDADVSTEILRYFRLRSAWELKKYGSLSAADIEWLKDASHRFPGDRFEGSYRAWTAGLLTERALRSEFGQLIPHRNVSFRTCLVAATRFGRKGLPEEGESALHPSSSPHSSPAASLLR
jgi:hypothetical protein